MATTTSAPTDGSWQRTLASVMLAVVLSASMVLSARAQDEVNSGRISLELGADLTSASYFRGYRDEDSELIVQPYAEVGVAIREGMTFLNEPDLDLFFGTWNALHEAQTDATDNGKDIWYEADFYGGATLSWETVELGVTYTVYTYPNSDTETVHEVALIGTYDVPDDSWVDAVFGDISLELALELDNSNVADDEAIFLGISGGPTFDLNEDDWTLSFPFEVGLSLDDYYVDDSDDTFGYLSLGAVVEFPLHSGPYGDITMRAGVTGLLLGDATEVDNGDDDLDGFAFIGVSVEY
ncbi:MAG: hypothetical protein AAF432_09595 [Planctomycetota bacterium]